MEDLLEPREEGPDTRLGGSPTELSRLCEGMVRTFLSWGAASATVRCDRIPYDREKVYKSLWDTCARRKYLGKVSVHKAGGEMVLVRGRKGGRL